MKIERRAHMVWLQGWDKIPDHLAAMVQGFVDLNPSWVLECWDDERIQDELDLGPGLYAYKAADQIVPPDSVKQLQADIARYAILRTHGGLTIDVDFHWLRPIDNLIGNHHAVGVYELNGSWIANGFLATTPGHLLPNRLINGIPERVKATAAKGLRANAITGPKYLTRVVGRLPYSARPWLHASDTLMPIPWNKPEMADRDDLEDLFPGAYGVHWWSHQHEIRGL